MKTVQQQQLEALKTFIDCGPLQFDIDILTDLQRHLAGSVMNESIDAEAYDNYLYLLHRIEDLLKALQVTANITQMFADRRN